MGFPGGAGGKESAGDIRDMDVTPVSGRSPGGGHGKPTPVFLPQDHTPLLNPCSLEPTYHN